MRIKTAVRKNAVVRKTSNRKFGVPGRPLLLVGTGCEKKSCSRRDKRETEAVLTALRLSARAMFPFYRRIAADGAFAQRWSDSVVGLSLDDMKRQLGEASPLAGRLEQGLGTNGIGYFVDYPAPGTADAYATGITIPPGTVQFYFPPAAHRIVAAALLPFCRALATDREYAAALVAAMEAGDAKEADSLVRSRIRANALNAVDASPGYLALDFKPAGSKYVYRNLFFREGV